MTPRISSLLLILLLFTTPIAFAQSPAGQAADPAQYVNTFIGTANSPLPDYLGGNSSGNTFPGATTPFGLVQWSPDTDKGFGQDERGSYLYADNTIRGFSLTHLSGPGCPVFGDLPIMPVTVPVKASPATSPQAYYARFSHSNEQASPGSYQLALGSGIRVSLSATTRTGLGRFTFPDSGVATVLFNSGRNANGVEASEVKVENDRLLSGSISSGGFCGTRTKYKLYFVAEFDRAIQQSGTWVGDNVTPGARNVTGKQNGLWVSFDNSRVHDVQLRIGLSYVSTANALANLRAESKSWDLDAARAAARARWNNALNSVKVKGGADSERRVFYTALYHTLLHPNVFSDANGDYLGFDERVHNERGRIHYTNFSGWDIYRSESPLIALLFPREASDMAQSLIVDAEQGGGLPIWPIANDESGAMYGDPSTPIIASTWAFGARDFDARAALRAMIKGATDPDVKSRTYPERPGLADFLRYGYIPMEQKGLRGSPSVALEYEIADFALAQFAAAQGDTATHRVMMRRAQWWTRIFDPQNKYIRGRWADGSWLPGFDFKAMLYDPKLPWSPSSHKSYVEGNATQYTWMIPHNIRGLIDRIGGNDVVVNRLDSFFTELNAGPDRPYFFIGNEPVFGVPWLYNYVGQPWKTQAITRRALSELFTNDPGGIPGNDDLGATSSWIVFASMGIYPIIPGVGGFALNSPLFPEIRVRLKGHRELRITGDSASRSTPYVQSLMLNGRTFENTWLPYERFVNGAQLDFKLGAEPNTRWATSPSAAPPSFGEGT